MKFNFKTIDRGNMNLRFGEVKKLLY
ncbi:hypothetical protein AGR13a_Lc30083 [Agrobacterium genomosp. 13 str. CFBP 6927]|uniref:Uncharacterized protein n=1 Tax=Agrobacterium genomosp. 13 str. CFBP 6927 TaxID=1183428 RepID=A0ABM9VM19_9HYPH|nr:hypothetical protein AGR13a_Lc30083 [Agrobacterium genomosp. 13 str. CFBP 6927]